jgi:hypothetical protein
MNITEIFETMSYGPAPESPDPVYAWLEARGGRFDLFINDEWTPPLTGEYVESTNPATGEVLAQTAQGGDDDVERAVQAARAAFESWSQTSTRWRDTSRSTTGGWRCWSRWTTASPSASRATSTYRLWPGTSTITPGGRS